MSRAQKERLDTSLHALSLKETNFQIIQKGQDGTFVDIGFIPNTIKGYGVFRNGNGVFVDGQKVPSIQQMEQIAPVIDKIILAGQKKSYIVGLSPTGTQMSWNSKNLSQQVILNPQQRTFKRNHVVDTVAAVNGPYLITASQNNMISTWSLVSGDLIRTVPTGTKPRTIVQNSHINKVYFGDNRGSVYVWNTTGRFNELYSHSGPVLNAVLLLRHNKILSVAKDGTANLYDLKSRKVVKRLEFSKAVYDIYVSPNEQYAIIIPAKGHAKFLNLTTMEDKVFNLSPSERFAGGEFYKNGAYFISQHGTQNLMMWDLKAGRVKAVINPEDGKGVIDFDITKDGRHFVIATTDNKIELWSAERFRYITTLLTSSKNIQKIALSDDGTKILSGFEDGEIIRMDVVKDVTALVRHE